MKYPTEMGLKWTWKVALSPAFEQIQKTRLDGSKAKFSRSVQFESRNLTSGWSLPRAGDNYLIPGLGTHIIDRVCFVNARPERKYVTTIYFRFESTLREMSTTDREIFLSAWKKEKLDRRDFKDLSIPLDDWVDPQIKFIELEKLQSMSKRQRENHQGIQLGYVNYLLHHFKNLEI
jgi:hypothetical protein